MKDFPLPVRSIGPGSQPEESDEFRYIAMPQGMQTYRQPLLPEPEDLAGQTLAKAALQAALWSLQQVLGHGGNRVVRLDHLPEADRRLLNTVLGEGEVSARVLPLPGADDELRVQESVFAGVWRVVETRGDCVVSDRLELGLVPEALQQAAAQDVWAEVPRWHGPLPPNVQNAPLLLAEIEDRWQHWRPGQPPCVINLTLLPMSQEDIGFMDHHLGTGRVLILSRGYGNCRITNTCMPHTWRVVYYNSEDAVILNTVEVGALPDVAQAAREDLEDSHERLRDVLDWVEQA
ncbi:hydrogenase expression/formation protein [Pseudorhodoferax sp. Leaf267]|uniref:hydrogenase expression/formation protein n=1 Tax=Pseudorhodoferax sp. Leaf267 TaxID=1736316 RepID=UPI0006F93C2B|nr:hydrogenase expression/formation protein [Pseudorhodoferax sp. Leaf267]KQP15008.1 hydrogenase [Pseudorhodoferax sp. Leaf267]